MKNRALITGATGFIGSHLAISLRNEGWVVAALAKPGSCAKLKAASLIEEVYEYDGKAETVYSALAEFKPDVVFHLASLFIVEHRETDIDSLVLSNILFGTQLLESMKHAGISCIVNAGTSWQNRTGGDYAPLNLYAATKQAFEAILQFYVESAAIRSITLRLFDTYGPGDTRGKIISRMIEALHEGSELQLSPGEQIIDLLHVRDACAAFSVAANTVLNQDGPASSIFAASGGERRTLRDIAKAIERLCGRPLQLKFGARPYRTREIMNPWSGPCLPGWVPKVSLEEGLRELLEENAKTGADRAP